MMDNPQQSPKEPEVVQSPEFELTGLQDFSSILQELSLVKFHVILLTDNVLNVRLPRMFPILRAAGKNLTRPSIHHWGF